MSKNEVSIELVEKIKELPEDIASKMLDILEREQKHRHEVEVNVRAAELRDMRRGQLFAFIIVMFFGVVGAFLIYDDHDLAGGLFGSSAILGIVTTFITGRKKRRSSVMASQKTTA
ncbi:hypothetical protein GV054_09240 [Marinomonas mediterranea]|uniref:hypothetical protein n=1 Tax=Marinomonas mediterranea TaxID=119864 RepID=UPI00234BC0A8|nr:hypothetical protein [Marinomonas mediterranea]WCN13178.1 hypothetical protein GV054_09240 [Marinomonas mediterranea]